MVSPTHKPTHTESGDRKEPPRRYENPPTRHNFKTDYRTIPPVPSELVAASDLARAVYCPRQLYYARRDEDRGPPPESVTRRNLAFRYEELLEAETGTLAALPIDPSPAAYRAALEDLADHPHWPALADPQETFVRLAGRDCAAVAHKVLPGEDGPPVPTIASPGVPPERGVWEPLGVRAVAVAKALAWEREREIPRALVEFPAAAVVREVDLTITRTARYRRALRTVRELDGPPPRLHDRAKCGACDYREQCGVRTRSLRSLLGL